MSTELIVPHLVQARGLRRQFDHAAGNDPLQLSDLFPAANHLGHIVPGQRDEEFFHPEMRTMGKRVVQRET